MDKTSLWWLKGLEGSIFIYLEYISTSVVETCYLSFLVLLSWTVELEGSETYIVYSDPLEFFSFSLHQCY